MSKHIINVSDGIGYSKPVVNQFSSGFDSIQFVLDLEQDISSCSFALAVSVCGDCFMIIQDENHLLKGEDSSTGKTYLDWSVGKEVTASDGVVIYQIIAYRANDDGTFSSIWYSPEGRLVVGESISLTEYETAQIGANPSVLMQILAKATANEAKASANSNEILNHRENQILDHPDQSVTTEKIADRAVTKDKVADGTVGISNLDADLTELLNSFANENSVSNKFDTLSQEVAAKVDKENGKALSSNDFTDDLKEKLSLLPNADSISEQFNALTEWVESKVDKESGKGLSSNDFTASHKQKLELLPNADSISQEFDTLSEDVANKVDKEVGKGLSTNDFTEELKQKLDLLPNADSISQEFDTLSEDVANKVDKEEGKGLSSNDFTDELKLKLESLPDANSPDLNLGNVSQRLKDLNDFSKKNYASSIKSSVQGEIIQVEDACPIEHIVSINVNLEKATETAENPKLYVCGKNLLNFANINGDVQGTYRGWLVNPNEQTITVSISDRDTSVDISGVYLGICNAGVDGSGGIIWIVEKGEIKRTLYSLNRKYISVYQPVTMTFEETIEKLTQRFYIQVEYGSEATSYEDFKGGKYEITQNEIDALSPSSSTMYIYTNVPGASIECQYNQDTKSYIDSKISALEESIANINAQLLQQ